MPAKNIKSLMPFGMFIDLEVDSVFESIIIEHVLNGDSNRATPEKLSYHSKAIRSAAIDDAWMRRSEKEIQKLTRMFKSLAVATKCYDEVNAGLKKFSQLELVGSGNLAGDEFTSLFELMNKTKILLSHRDSLFRVIIDEIPDSRAEQTDFGALAVVHLCREAYKDLAGEAHVPKAVESATGKLQDFYNEIRKHLNDEYEVDISTARSAMRAYIG